MSKRWFRSAGLVVAGVLLASACSSPGGNTGGTDKGEIIIASDLPVSGADASDGIPTQNGVQFAVESTGSIKGFKLTWKGFDDTVNGAHDPQKGVQNVQQMLSDSKILGMVGPFNSPVAAAEIPVGNQGPLAMVSPSNTNNCLTQESFGGKPCTDPNPKNLRPTGKNNYFRIAAPDSFQGPAMADYAYDTLKLTKVAVWSDNEIFGKGVADTFQQEFEKKGGKVVVRQDFDTKVTNDWKPFLTDAKSKGAGGVYAGATSGTKACIPNSQMAGIIDGPYMTPDGGVNSQCLKDSGSNTKNLYGTVAGANAELNPDAKATIDAYKAKYTKKEDLGSYTFMAYDCAKILIDAIGRAIDANGGKMPSRQQVIDALAKTKDLKLTTGTYTFDKNGDPTTPVMSIYQVQGNDWKFIKQFAVGGS